MSLIFEQDTWPNVPYHLVLPLLTASQKAIWKSLAVPDMPSGETSFLYQVIVDIDPIISGTRSDDEREIERAMNTDPRPVYKK
jgi:hypothetical protein